MNTTAKTQVPSNLEARRALLAERLRKVAAPAAPTPLSFGQQRLWFLQQLEPDSALYNVPVLASLSGPLEVRILTRSLNRILQRHESLRTLFQPTDEEPIQSVQEEAAIQLQCVDLRGVAASQRAEEAQRLAREEFNRPFNLSKDLPIRGLLVRMDAEEHLLALTIHHVAFDEWSLAIFFRELSTHYEAIRRGDSGDLPVLPVQYGDFAVWQRDWLRGEVLQTQLGYWRERLSGSPPMIELPTDRPRRPTPTFRGAQEAREIGADINTALRQLAERTNTTPFMVLLAGFAAWLHRYTEQEDILIGCPIAGRNRVETQQLIGFFVNTLLLRLKATGDLTFEQLLARVRESTLGAYAHQDAPFEKIVEELQPERSLAHLPFTRVMFVLQTDPMEETQLGPVKLRFLPAATDTSKFDFTLVLQDTSRGWVARAEYNTDLFEPGTVARFLEHFERLLRGAIAVPDKPISSLPLLTEAERQLIVTDWNRTEREYPRESCIHELFESVAARSPGAPALVFDGKTLTYGELNERANQLAHYLRQRNIGSEAPVAVCLERSMNMIIAWLAILKAGGAYVPLDASYPKERLGFMLRDTAAPVLVTQQSLLAHVPCDGVKVIALDADWELITRESRRNPINQSGPEKLAYIIYTSGSTGEPKGVAVPHRAVNRLVLNTNYIELDARDRIAQVSNASFDAATFEVWGALLNGGQLIGIAQDTALAPAAFARELKDQKISAMFLTSALFNQLAREAPGAFRHMRTLMAGGEALDPKWVRSVLHDGPPRRLVNGYGPTENTTFTCCHLISAVEPDATQVPIGRPIANTQVYILDRYRNPVPIGVAGELYTGGDGLACGYWNRSELTAKKFVANPFDPSGKSRLYRTGDSARYLPDGTIEYLGRIDQQVKVRGFRIELGEIETVLARHPGVEQCIVQVHGRSAETRRLVAYFLSKGNPPPNSSDLRSFLAERLPEYMIPAVFIALSELPLTANGKINRQALPAPDQVRPELERQYAPPKDEVERRLTEIWESVLRVKPIGVHDKFFDLGGHSLLAVRLTTQIQKAFGKQLRLATIFQAPTIEQLAAILRDEAKESAGTNSIVELQARGIRPPLFLVHGAGGGMFWGYANLSRHLGMDQPVYGFNSRGLEGLEELDRIEDLAAQYVRDLRARQPEGPYHLGGYCFGGNVAYEMARQLTQQGQRVALLALFNCAPPNSRYTRIPWTPRWFARFLRNLLYWANYFCQWSPPQRREFFRWKWSLLKKRFARRPANGAVDLDHVEAGDLVDLSSYTPDQRKVWEAHLRALVHYHPQPFNGRAHLFRSPGHPLWCSFDPDYGWGDLARAGVTITRLPGAHEKILEEPCVGVLARALGEVLAQDEVRGREVIPPTTSQREQNRIEYWKRQFEGAPQLLELPADVARPAGQNLSAGKKSFRLPAAVTQRLENRDSDQSNTTQATLLATLAVLLHRYTGRESIVMGVSAGLAPEPFAEALPLRCDLAGDRSFQSVVDQVRTLLGQAQQIGPVPVEKLASALGLAPTPSYAPVFQIGIRFEKSAAFSARSSSADSAASRANLDLVLNLQVSGAAIEGELIYNPALFEEARMARMAEHFITLVSAAIAGPSRPISLLPLLSEQELRQMAEWNGTQMDYARDKRLIDLIGEQVARTPDAEALVWGATRVSYRQLYGRAEQFARALQAGGVGPGQLVGVCVERSVDMLAGLLGTWIAGAAYVPLDPAYPRERLAFMVEDAQVSAIITQRKLSTLLPHEHAALVIVEDVTPEQGSSASPVAPQEATSLAYVIYTSGSTGRPKGVALEHRGGVAFAHWARQCFSREDLAGVLASTSICFDLSVFELFVPLCWGGRVILVENALSLPGLANANEVTLINTVPSAIRELLRLRGVPASVQVINLAGEPLPAELVDQMYGETNVRKVFDLYGPTETTTYSTGALRESGKPPTIGRPLANEQIFLLDGNRQLVPIGVPGEVYIGGDGLARGYLNRPELTAERFVPHPFQPGERLYKTGDLARWRSDGNLEFLGRIDHQVKIRGFRIELGEVESVLKKHPATCDVVLMAREDVPGDKRLVAYITLHAEASVTAAELRAHARKALPEYMVPSAFVFLETFPLTPNGKVDRRALPAPAFEITESTAAAQQPRSKQEQQMTALWQEVLGVKAFGIRDDFFDLGGHSLLATRLVSRIRDVFRVDLPLDALFSTPTVAGLCERLRASSTGRAAQSLPPITPGPRSGKAPLAFVQERLWFLDQLNPSGHAYNVPFALRLEGPLNLEALRRAVAQVIGRHESLRTTFRLQSGELVQEVSSNASLEIDIQDLTGPESRTALERARDWANAEAKRPFDLSRGPLLRVSLGNLAPDDHILTVVMHHIISDGWSMAVFFGELEAVYQALSADGSAAVLPDLPIGYIDFAQWQRRTQQGTWLDEELHYWRDKLAGAPESVNLPLDRPEPAQPTGHATRSIVVLDNRLSRMLFNPGSHHGCTAFVVLLAGLAATLSKWTGQADLVLGTVMAGRTRSELERLIGCFMNFVPLRIALEGLSSGRDLLARARDTVLEGQVHQECPFEKIVEAINPERRLNQNPLYNVGLLLQNFPPELFRNQNLHVTPVPVALDSALLDLRFEVERIQPQTTGNGQDGEYALACEYRTELFEESTIRELLTSYVGVLDKLLSEPAVPLADCQITAGLAQQAQASRARQQTRRIALSATFTAEPLEAPLRYWFRRLEWPADIEFAPYNQVFQQLLDPGSLLATNQAGFNVVLIRLEDWLAVNEGAPGQASQAGAVLRRNASEFAAALKAAAARVGNPHLVCLCPPSVEMAADPNYARLLEEAERFLAAELEPVGGVYLLTHAEVFKWHPVRDYYDSSADKLGHVPYTPAYFTALGTAIVRKLHALQRSAHKVIVLDCDQTLWGGVCGEDGPTGVRLEPPYVDLQNFMRQQHEAGRLLCLCSKNNEEDALEVFARRLEMPLRREHFTAVRLNWSPKSENLRSLAQELNLGLDSFIFIDDNPVECAEVAANCPEALTLQLPADPQLIPQFLQQCWVFDHLKLTVEDRRRTELYRQNVERERLRQASPGLGSFLAGLELKIAIEPIRDAQVPRVAQLTQRTNQFNCTTRRLTEQDVQLLRVGGDILTVQVKDRFGDYGLVGVVVSRTENDILDVSSFLLSCRVLGRGVEHQVLAHLGELALARGISYVDVHFVRSEKNKPAVEFLERVGHEYRQALNGGFIYRFPAAVAAEIAFQPSEQPAALVPAPTRNDAAPGPAVQSEKFSQCAAIALATMDLERLHKEVEAATVVRRSGRRAGYVAPANTLERQICEVWERLLKAERIGTQDNFFELGGHSLLAVRLFAELEKLTGRRLPLVTLFQAPTVAALARALAADAPAGAHPLLVPIQPRGSKPPLFLVHGAGGDVLWGYANLAAYLTADQPIYGIKSRGQAGFEEATSLGGMAADYVEAVRSLQPAGPYYLGGYCFGGNVAYEMARQLRIAGEEVALVALLDAAPSNAGYEHVAWWRPDFSLRFCQNLGLWLNDFRALQPGERRNFVARKIRSLGRKLIRRLRLAGGAGAVDLEEIIDPSHFPAAELKLWQSHLQALIEHVEQPYEGEVCLFRTRGQPLFCSYAEDFCWGKLARAGVQLRIVPGSHENVFMEPNVEHLAKELSAALQRTQANGGRHAA